ncbi:MAG: glycoside hydrolase family 2 protein [bacterium]
MFNQSICLNGEWQFQPDSGVLQYPPTPNWAKTKIRIPSPWNVNGFYPDKGGDFKCYPSYPKEWEFAAAGWHRKEFSVPSQWQHQRIVLHFEGIHYYSEIYLNGKLIGKHEDGFIPFELDITDSVKIGEINELIVGVKSFLFYNRQTPLDAKTKFTYPTGSFWGMTVSGIWLDVFLVAYPVVNISDIYIQTSVRKKQITIQSTIRNHSSQKQQVILTHNIRNWKTISQSITLPPNSEKNISTAQSWPNPQYWHPENPYLYYLDTILKTESGISDKRTTRFGFREFWIDKNRFILNGTPIKLRGDAWHYLGIAYQNPEYARLWYQLVKQTNMNHVRLHAQIYPRYYLDLADEMGILITDETAIWASHCVFHYNNDFWHRAKDHAFALVKRNRNHPSVIIWSVENEALAAYTFVQDDAVKSNDDLARRFYSLTKEMRKLDSTRPISADGSYDLGGRTEIYNIHYPPLPQLKDKVKGKPITVGEFGSMYYSTPDDVSILHGESTYLRFSERLKAVAKEQERMIFYIREWANQVSPFNAAWYSMLPLPFSGKPINYKRLDTPGPKPERIGPYSSTLNPGYDPVLPKWQPNEFYPYLKKLLAPVRFYIHEQDKSYFAGTKFKRILSIHNDSYTAKKLQLYWSARLGKSELGNFKKKAFILNAANKTIQRLEFNIPRVDKRTLLSLRIKLISRDNVVYQEKRDFDIIPKLHQGKLPSFPQLTGFKDKPYIVLPPDLEFNVEDITVIKKAVKQGLKVIGLENNESFLKSLGYATIESGTYDRAFIQLPRNRILDNINNANVRFWGKEELIAHAHLANFPKGNFHPLINLGNGKPVLIEICDGNGAYYISTLDIAKYYQSEPGAVLLYQNLIAYAALPIPSTFSKTTLVGKEDTALSTFLDYLGAEYLISNNLNQLNSSTLIVDGSISLDKKSVKYVSEYIKKGGIAIIWGLNPETNKYYAPLFPCPLKLQPRNIEHLVKVSNSPLLTGIHAADLYWIERDRRNPILHYSAEPQKPDLCEIILGNPALDWRTWNWEAEPIKTAAILKSELAAKLPANGLIRFRLDKGQLIINQLCFNNTNLVKSGKVASLLLSNLGIRLNPDKALQFTASDLAIDNNKQKLELLLNPAG